MIRVQTLTDLYQQIPGAVNRVCVVPLIGHAYKDTDYLYQLYAPLLTKHSAYNITEITAVGHIRLPFLALFQRRTVLLHYHWLEFQDLKSIAGMPWKLLSLWLYLLFGGRLIWTVHNLRPHDKKLPGFHLRLHRWFSKKAMIIHVHSEFAAREVYKHYQIKKKKIRILGHPPYPAHFVEKTKALENLKKQIKATIPADTSLLLVFGAISEYKGIREILNIFQTLEGKYTLLIAGYLKKNQESLDEHIKDFVKRDPRIIYRQQFIPADLYPSLLSAADLCIFNHDYILTSGVVEMARSYNKKIIAPMLGPLQEIDDPSLYLFRDTTEMKNLIESQSSLNE